MLAAMLIWPRAFYPLLWVSGVFLLEPLCRSLGRRSLLYLLKELILPGEPRLSLSAERRESEAPEVGAPAA